jgi:hypothetical protein
LCIANDCPNAKNKPESWVTLTQPLSCIFRLSVASDEDRCDCADPSTCVENFYFSGPSVSDLTYDPVVSFHINSKKPISN